MGPLSQPTNPLLPLPPLQRVNPPLCPATFPSSPTRSSLFLPSKKGDLGCDLPLFQTHQPAPPSSSTATSESSFVTCHVSKLTNPLLPLPPLQEVSPRL